MELPRGAAAILAACAVALMSGCAHHAAGGNSTVPSAARAPIAQDAFTDVTQQAGIHFQHVNGANGQFYYPETFGSGCAFIDYDRDGYQDILLVNSSPWPAWPSPPGPLSQEQERGSRPDHRRPRQGEAGTPPTLALYRNNGNGTFTDVTVQTGLNISLYGMGVAVGDYDNDGFDDLYVTGLDHCLLLHNESVGSAQPAAVAVGAGRRPGPQVSGLSPLTSHLSPKSPALPLSASPSRVFRDVTATAGVSNSGHWGTSAAWLDYDRDGKLDLFVCDYVRWSPDQEQVCHQGDLRIYCGPLVYPADSCRLYHNLGGGKFRDVTREAGIYKTTGKSLGVAVWDLDGDGYPEIVVANDLTPNYLFHNNRNGTFSEVGLDAGISYGADATARSGMGIDVADTRGDGRSEIFITNFAREPNSFFEQDTAGTQPPVPTVGAGRRPGPQDSGLTTHDSRLTTLPLAFTDRTYETGMGEPSLIPLGFGAFFFDFDNDGWTDAFVTNGHIQPEIARYEPSQSYAQEPLLFRNRGDGTFEEVHNRFGPALRTTIVGRGAVWGDYDNDGRLDILLTANNGPVRLLHNDVDTENAWLRIRLIGRKSNRDGLGAEVRVTGGGRTQRDQARSGSSYLSSSDLRLHFGLGRVKVADVVEVRWPSGVVDRLATVAANQEIAIREGDYPRKSVDERLPGARRTGP